MTCRLRPGGAEDVGQVSEQEDLRVVESISKRPGSEGASGGMFC